MIKETRVELVDKIIKAYELETRDVADAVELYYDSQKLRIMHANRDRSEPPPDDLPENYTPLARWLNLVLHFGETVISGKLKQWVESDKSPAEAKWAIEQWGIGHILAAGLAAHIDIEKANTPSAVWKFAGLAPGFDRKVKKVKLPYNSRLKVLTWKVGESFVKVSGRKDAFYGQLYAQFKAEEIARNQGGKYAEAAARELATKNITDKETKEKLESGKLTDGHLHSRAKRRATKVFLCHYYLVGRRARNLPCPAPYSETILGHSGIIHPIYPAGIAEESPKQNQDEQKRMLDLAGGDQHGIRTPEELKGKRPRA